MQLAPVCERFLLSGRFAPDCLSRAATPNRTSSSTGFMPHKCKKQCCCSDLPQFYCGILFGHERVEKKMQSDRQTATHGKSFATRMSFMSWNI